MEKLLCKALSVLLLNKQQLANLTLLELFEKRYASSCQDNETSANKNNNNNNDLTANAKEIIIPIVFGLIVLIGTVGNVLVFLAVWKRALRTTTNLFIVNLAIADLLFVLFCAPFHAVIYTDRPWIFGQIACKLVHLLQYASMLASSWTLVAMSADRLLGLRKRLKNARIALLISCSIWLAALIFSIPWPIVYTVREYYGKKVCSDAFDSIKIRLATFLSQFIFGYVLPLMAIAVFSYLLVKRLWSVPQTETSNATAKKKVTRLIISVVLAFAICWLPTHLFSLYINFKAVYSPHDFQPSTAIFVLRQFSHVISYANSAINPILYAMLSRHFRLAFKRVLGCRRTNSNQQLHMQMQLHQQQPHRFQQQQQQIVTHPLPRNVRLVNIQNLNVPFMARQVNHSV